MVNDKYTSPYVRIYITVVAVFLIFGVGGALWFSQSPAFSVSYVVSKLKVPLYTIQYYLETNTLANVSSVQRASKGESAAASVPALIYHGVLDEPDNSGDLTPEQFKEHMFALKKAGYESVTLADFVSFVRGEKDLPQKSVLITFDDGRRDSYYNGGPILSALGYNAVMYSIGTFTEPTSTDSIYYLSGRETKMLAESDTWEIGSHSYNGHRQVAQDPDGTKQTYFFAGRMWNEEENRQESFDEFRRRIAEDLRRSKTVLEEITEQPITTFAFPFGNYGESTEGMATEEEIKYIVLGEAENMYDLLFYQTAPHQYFTQAYVASDSESREQNLVRRITISNDITGEELISKLQRGAAKALPYEASLTPQDGWVEAWGSLAFVDDTLVLDGRGFASGAATILDGTRHWTNYRIDARVTSKEGSSAILMVRYGSGGDHISCNYGRDFVHINQTINGTERVIRGVDKIPVLDDGGNTVLNIGAEVEGRSVRCLLGGRTMVETQFSDPSLDRGGVGFKTWKAEGNASIVIHSFFATSMETLDTNNL